MCQRSLCFSTLLNLLPSISSSLKSKYLKKHTLKKILNHANKNTKYYSNYDVDIRKINIGTDEKNITLVDCFTIDLNSSFFPLLYV